jgi:hypothetical protein
MKTSAIGSSIAIEKINHAVTDRYYNIFLKLYFYNLEQ